MSHDKISSIILTHWQKYHPKMLEQLRQENRLEAELEVTAQQFADLMHDLMTVGKMDYRAAWEMAIEQFLLPGEEGSSSTSRNQKSSPPATSE